MRSLVRVEASSFCHEPSLTGSPTRHANALTVPESDVMVILTRCTAMVDDLNLLWGRVRRELRLIHSPSRSFEVFCALRAGQVRLSPVSPVKRLVRAAYINRDICLSSRSRSDRDSDCSISSRSLARRSGIVCEAAAS
jgi:hypothetical protein